MRSAVKRFERKLLLGQHEWGNTPSPEHGTRRRAGPQLAPAFAGDTEVFLAFKALGT